MTSTPLFFALFFALFFDRQIERIFCAEFEMWGIL